MDKNHIFKLKCNQVLALVNVGMSNKEIMASAKMSKTMVQMVRRLARSAEQQNRPPEEILAMKPRSGAPNTIVSKRNVAIVRKRVMTNPNKSMSRQNHKLEGIWDKVLELSYVVRTATMAWESPSRAPTQS